MDRPDAARSRLLEGARSEHRLRDRLRRPGVQEAPPGIDDRERRHRRQQRPDHREPPVPQRRYGRLAIALAREARRPPETRGASRVPAHRRHDVDVHVELHRAGGIMSIDPDAGRLAAYLGRLGLSLGEQATSTHLAMQQSDVPTAFTTLHSDLADTLVDAGNPAFDSLGARLRQAVPDDTASRGCVVGQDVQGRARLVTTPKLARVSMVPRPWSGDDPHASTTEGADRHDASPLGGGRRKRWYYVANRRRLVLMALALVQTWLATMMMSAVLPYHGQKPLEVAILVLFAILFTWVSMGFWTALAGFLVLARGGDRHAISGSLAGNAKIAPEARTAIVMPICNENVPRVFAGLRATFESLERTGDLEHFDFFVLSDSN